MEAACFYKILVNLCQITQYHLQVVTAYAPPPPTTTTKISLSKYFNQYFYSHVTEVITLVWSTKSQNRQQTTGKLTLNYNM
jgi:hypothetical protein